MPEGKQPRGRSVSETLDHDSDLDSHYEDDGSLPGKPGRKKNPNSQAARRDQNRIAQREFRLRKQQRIRDLEARVEILSGGQDEALDEMRNILKDLMAENQTLRGLIRSLAAFIGDGAGGLLPKLGWEMSDFNRFVNKGETDTAWEGYQRRKKQASDNPALSGQKRPAEDEGSTSRLKKARGDELDSGRSQNGFPLLSMNPPGPLSSNGLYGGGSRTHEGGGGMFSDLMRSSSNSPMFQQGSPTAQPYGSSSMTNYSSSYVPGVNLNIEPSLASMPPYSPSTTTTTPAPPATSGSSTQRTESLEPLDENDDPTKAEAYKLIHYHLENYKRNNQYCLPSSLRPTLVQRTVPHESAIDGILHGELRDRMILYRNRYELVECLIDFRRAITIHGDDVLAHTNWEIGESFLRQYNFLIEKNTLNLCNRWRKERGEPELRMADIGNTEDTPPV